MLAANVSLDHRPRTYRSYFLTSFLVFTTNLFWVVLLRNCIFTQAQLIMVRVLEWCTFTLQFKANNNDSLCVIRCFLLWGSSVLLELVKTWVWFYFFFIFSVHRFLSFSQCAALQFKFKTTLLDFLLINCLSQKEQKNLIQVKEIFKVEKILRPLFFKGV